MRNVESVTCHVIRLVVEVVERESLRRKWNHGESLNIYI